MSPCVGGAVAALCSASEGSSKQLVEALGETEQGDHATQLPATGVIYLDHRGYTSIVTNTITLEKVSLPGRWDIQYDPDGSFAVAFRDEGEHQEVRDVDDLMRKTVFQRIADVDLVIVEKKDGATRWMPSPPSSAGPRSDSISGRLPLRTSTRCMSSGGLAMGTPGSSGTSLSSTDCSN